MHVFQHFILTTRGQRDSRLHGPHNPLVGRGRQYLSCLWPVLHFKHEKFNSEGLKKCSNTQSNGGFQARGANNNNGGSVFAQTPGRAVQKQPSSNFNSQQRQSTNFQNGQLANQNRQINPQVRNSNTDKAFKLYQIKCMLSYFRRSPHYLGDKCFLKS